VSVTTHRDRTFDRRQHFDEASRAYPIRTVVGKVERVAKQWRPGLTIDQGQEGECVGYGWTGELLASPVRVKVRDEAAGNALAHGVYQRAQQLDDWPGENYEGTAVIAGAKALVERGYMPEYRWAFGIDDVIDTLVAHGPVVVGTNWHDSMYETRPSGLIEVSGPVVGAHCWLLYGYHPSMRLRGEDWKARFEVVRMRNSWGLSYGLGGSGFVKVTDMAALLTDGGEACVPVRRAYGPVV
jgi:hypothetical protein